MSWGGESPPFSFQRKKVGRPLIECREKRGQWDWVRLGLRFGKHHHSTHAMHFTSVYMFLPPPFLLPRRCHPAGLTASSSSFPLFPPEEKKRMAWTDLRTVDKKQFRASVFPVNSTTWSSAAEEEKRIASNSINGSGKKQLNTFR